MAKKVIQFDHAGRPIGDNSAAYASDLGDFSRAHASISYEKWVLVDPDQKKAILKAIKDKYDVSDTTDEKILGKANEYWRKFKCRVRTHYDKYATNEERKRNCAKCVRQDDWERFVDNESTIDARARRARGKRSREAMQAKQRSGRKGAARIAHEMREREPNIPVTRTRLYLALHSGSDEIHLTDEHNSNVEKVKHICQENPSSVMLDVDHDPVNQVYGRDKKRLRGMGGGISRRGLVAAGPTIIQLEKQIGITSTLTDKVNRMEVFLQKHDEYFGSIVSRQGPNIQSFAETSRSQSGSPSLAPGFPPAGFPPNVRETACKLFSMRGEHAANGTAIIGDRADEDFESSPERFETYDVFLDRVLLPNVTSTNRDTLGEENIGSMITWPKAFTVLAR